MGINILVVEDEKDIRDIVVELLSEEGHNVIGCNSLESAYDFIKNNKLDFVITDFNLGHSNKNGHDVILTVKEFQPKCEVVLVSGNADLNVFRKAEDLGAKAALTKPFDFSEIEGFISQIQKE